MDCWQYWDAVKEDVEKNKTGLVCINCGYKFSKTMIKKRFGNMFKPCHKCKGEVRFYRKINK